ncbi:hypothetical protein E3T43_01265 [Cryobacterium sp. Hh7]|uniref:DUF6093 family protein n=1 Tax=Cryobacterium sp. Hh7 TaxID=1259159 RepID=UPI00106D6DA8|nr:DUF6093 family protein [Cryobacterium sp. Hh7]TFD61128.1 hypothetical protein E3T43_01265 [Cryobacterium sp. Hh7]
MSILGGALAMGRAQANARMSESVTVTTTTPGTTMDETTGTYPDVIVSHYAGIARIKYPTLTVSEKTPVGQTLAAQDVTLHLPVGLASQVSVDDVVTVTGSTVDSDLIGCVFRIKGLAQAGQVSAHRFPLRSDS